MDAMVSLLDMSGFSFLWILVGELRKKLSSSLGNPTKKTNDETWCRHDFGHIVDPFVHPRSNSPIDDDPRGQSVLSTFLAQ